MSENRPDSFLRLIRRSQRGRLKIYLGYCAGVGKTYQMLQEAHRMRKEGIDVAVGLAETHGRQETESLLAELEVIPRRRQQYHGIEIGEMDLVAILARRPTVVLVDELAHTNVPGSRNAKRYQDVEEILAAGIHVVSTLNVQHLESLYDTVEKFTGVRVRERIPDKVVVEADEVVNVDLTVEDLRQRLREGKVYTAERVETALDHFFRPQNLGQLRELTLRELAAQLDSRRRDAQPVDGTPSPDQLMVCLSSRGPNSDMLLRHASRLAGRLNRNWYAVYVQTAAEIPTAIDAATQRLLSNTLSLAQQLGATVFTYRGDDIVSTILAFAREYRVAHIVIGTPSRRLPLWRRMLGERTLVERLVEQGRGISLIVIDTRSAALIQAEPRREAEAPPVVELAPSAPPSFPAVTAEQVLIWEQPPAMDEAIRQLVVATTFGFFPLPAQPILEAVRERESQGTTYLTDEVVLPHARIENLGKPVLAVGLSRAGIVLSGGGAPVRVVLLLLSPAEPADAHVRALAAVSRRVGQGGCMRELVEARTPAEVVALFAPDR